MLMEKYQKEIVPLLKKKLGIDNDLAVPRVEKVVINMGVADAKDDRQLLEQFCQELAAITGQKPVVCRAKKSISGFKLRKGEPIGLKVTLRGKRMYHFLARLFHLALPRLRDFRGLSEDQFDREANFHLGLPEQTVFPEIDLDKVKKIKGFQVTIVTSTKDRKAARLLLSLLGLPFAKEKE